MTPRRAVTQSDICRLSHDKCGVGAFGAKTIKAPKTDPKEVMRATCPAWPKCACIVRGRKDIDCQRPYGQIPISEKERQYKLQQFYERNRPLYARYLPEVKRGL